MCPSILLNPGKKGNIICKVPGRAQHISDELLEPGSSGHFHDIHCSCIFDTMSLCEVLGGTHFLLAGASPILQAYSFKEGPKHAAATPSRCFSPISWWGATKSIISATSYTARPTFQSGAEGAMITRSCVCRMGREFERLPQQRCRFSYDPTSQPHKPMCPPICRAVVGSGICIHMCWVGIWRRVRAAHSGASSRNTCISETFWRLGKSMCFSQTAWVSRSMLLGSLIDGRGSIRVG